MSTENVELVRELFELWGNRDYERAGELIDPDVVFLRVGVGDLSGEWRGLSASWAAMVDFMRAWEDLRTELERPVDLGDRVLAFARQTGRGRKSGVIVEAEIAFLFTLRDDKVVRWEGYWDRAEAMRAAGLEA
jgi:ketosteroid isomerase-like protein